MREAVGGAALVADLFAGLGTFALALSGKVYAGEGARDVALALKAAANRAGRTVFVEHRDLFRRPLDAAELNRFEAVVLDPPRAGAREQVAALAALDRAAPRLCVLQSRDLRARRENAGRRRLPARMGAAGRPVPLVHPCRARRRFLARLTCASKGIGARRIDLMGVFKNFFTWWEGASTGTALFSWRNGVKVGGDDLGNAYFEAKKGGRRWVMYSGSNDVSRLPPEWYAWLTRQIEGVPDDALPPAPKFLRAATAESDRHGRGLSPGRRARAGRPPRRRDRRLSGLDARRGMTRRRALVPSGGLLALAACGPSGAPERNTADSNAATETVDIPQTVTRLAPGTTPMARAGRRASAC